jgi:hypothetical protein
MARRVLRTEAPEPEIAITVISSGAHWLEEMARAYSGEHAALVERRILEGENRIQLPYWPDVVAARNDEAEAHETRQVVYLVPSWWKQPGKRWAIARARWAWRRRRPGKERRGDPLEGQDPRDLSTPLAEIDLACYGCMSPNTAAAWGRRELRERELRAEPIAYPVSVTYRGIDGSEYVVRLT